MKVQITIGGPEQPDDRETTAAVVDVLNATSAKHRAAGIPHVGTVCLACCACFRVLQNNGSLKFWNPTVSQPEAAVFASAKEADKQARKLGWMATDEGNHRCPECYEKFKKLTTFDSERHGCYIPASAVDIQHEPKLLK